MNKSKELGEWIVFLSRNIHSLNRLQIFLKYVIRLQRNGCPVIFDMKHLAQLFEVDATVCSSMIISSSSFYYKFSIPKRKGGVRDIAAPFPLMYEMQNWIYKKILFDINIHESATGFVFGKSVVDNAKIHLENPVILKMDLKDFFPSVSIKRVIAVFRRLGYTKKISYYLASLCCLDGKLPQGAPTSPILSNIVVFDLDRRLFGLANKFKLQYTRYADDLTFSGDRIPMRYIDYVTDIVCDEGFMVNEEKTQLLLGSQRKIVTGISISSGKLTIPREVRREIRKQVFYIQKRGISNHLTSIGSSDPVYIERLLGRLNFWHLVEPGNEFVNKSILDLNNLRKQDFKFLYDDDYLI